jgi:hypothetical protein
MDGLDEELNHSLLAMFKSLSASTCLLPSNVVTLTADFFGHAFIQRRNCAASHRPTVRNAISEI